MQGNENSAKLNNINIKEQIEKINDLLSGELLQYYINDLYNNRSTIINCVKTLDEIKNSNIINDNNRDIFEVIYQAFKDRKELLDKNEKSVNNSDGNNANNK